MNLLSSNMRLTELQKHCRPTAVAGTFYPGDRLELQNMVNDLLRRAAPRPVMAKALIAPHAGYIYSGAVAASAYATLLPRKDRIKRVVLLGPAHRVYVKGLALSHASHFASPLGEIKVDTVAVEQLKKLKHVFMSDEAHAQEHSLEVHLPFLQSVLNDFLLIPLVVGDATTEQVTEVLEAVWGDDDTLIVISSDLSHYHDYETANQIDRQTSQAIEQMRLEDITTQMACGCRPIQGLLNIARQRNMQVSQIDLCNSGDTAGTRDRVVGYASYVVKAADKGFSLEQQDALLDAARRSIRQGLESKQPWQPETGQYPVTLGETRATFVTLKLANKLRGCIGTLEAISPLINSVAENAFKAAFKDPRFAPLTAQEFEDIDISISVLSPKQPLRFASETDLLSQLRPGIDGLVIQKGQRSATFLPSVWENLNSPEQFLGQLKLKAGLQANDQVEQAWRYESESIPQ